MVVKAIFFTTTNKSQNLFYRRKKYIQRSTVEFEYLHDSNLIVEFVLLYTVLLTRFVKWFSQETIMTSKVQVFNEIRWLMHKSTNTRVAVKLSTGNITAFDHQSETGNVRKHYENYFVSRMNILKWKKVVFDSNILKVTMQCPSWLAQECFSL